VVSVAEATGTAAGEAAAGRGERVREVFAFVDGATGWAAGFAGALAFAAGLAAGFAAAFTGLVDLAADFGAGFDAAGFALDLPAGLAVDLGAGFAADFAAGLAGLTGFALALAADRLAGFAAGLAAALEIGLETCLDAGLATDLDAVARLAALGAADVRFVAVVFAAALPAAFPTAFEATAFPALGAAFLEADGDPAVALAAAALPARPAAGEILPAVVPVLPLLVLPVDAFLPAAAMSRSFRKGMCRERLSRWQRLAVNHENSWRQKDLTGAGAPAGAPGSPAPKGFSPG
jgi:hypothetical protein